MTNSHPTYLNLLRGVAALAVFVSHATPHTFVGVFGDLLTGGVVAVNVYAARYADLRFGRVAGAIGWGRPSPSRCICCTIRCCSSTALPLPLLMAAVLGSVLLLGQMTERQKDRLRAWLLAAFAIIDRRLAPIRPIGRRQAA